jgi:hypothetical protein
MTTASARAPQWRRIIRRVLIRSLLLACFLVVLVGLRSCHAFRDRSPGYTLDLNIASTNAAAQPRPFRAGFGRMQINPKLVGTNADHRPAVWMAGFSQNRAATAIHDDLWAVATVLDDGHTRLGVVVLDAIGFFHDDVVAVRRQLPAELKLNYTVVCSTHNHSTPDLMGLWGPSPWRTGVDPNYRRQVISGAVAALSAAVRNLQAVRLVVHEIPTAPAGLLTDTRKPEVYDADIRVLQFLRADDGGTLGTIVGWANHPETVWSRNTEITADFPGYLREALEHGVTHNGALLEAGVGGIHLYVNGAVGGLMSTTPNVTVRDPYLQQDFKPPSHEKARALGRQLASRILPRLEATNLPALTHAPISIRARTIEIPLENAAFLLAPVLGVLDRGHVRWKTMRSEVALMTVGPASIACIPGEIYPELVNGGIESPAGGDFPGPPVEVPPLRELMPGGPKFIFGLANDEIGYIIPRTEWDRQAPYLYGAKKSPYGEVNSVGPAAAEIIHRTVRELAGRP